ncbi:hypothetical protein H7X66_01130 [Dysgonomonas sp. BGC7]|nr:hypothetical protein [Dysgonomonas sp. BGC7]
MKKVIFCLILTVMTGLFSYLQAQVTIGSGIAPDQNALLDLKENGSGSSSKGLLLPRVALSSIISSSPLSAHIKGMTVYNTATTSVGNGYDVSPGFYYNDGARWISLPLGYTKWFYMPSISINTATTGAGRTLDLYALYKAQFSTPKIKSTGAPTSIHFLPLATDLYYYITDYDASVFSNLSINANGLLTYDVTATATECSFINIVFVIR